MNAVVVGAGVAGLSAAVRLADAGAKVTVLESGKEAGGRVRRMEAPSGRGYIDRGQHLMLGCYHETLALAARIGSASRARRVTGTTPFLSGPEEIHPYRLGQLPAPFHALSAMSGLTQLSWKERLNLVRAMVGAKIDLGGSADRLDRESAFSWLSRHGQSGNAIATFWEPIILATLNVPPKDASAFLLAAVLVRAFGGSRSDSESMLPATTLHDFLVGPAVEALTSRGCRIVHRAEVVRLTAKDGRVTSVACRSGESFDGDAFVLAVPPWRMAPLAEGVPELARIARSAKALGTSSIVGVDLWFDRPWMEYPYAGLLNSPVQWAFAHAQDPVDGAARVSVVMSAAKAWNDLPPAEIAKESEAELRKFFPRARTAKLVDVRVVKAPRATLRGSPGQRELRPMARTEIRNLFLAGDWIATELPATIEGAILSGRLAAEAVAR